VTKQKKTDALKSDFWSNYRVLQILTKLCMIIL